MLRNRKHLRRVALIFYYGASFANVWANASGKPIQPLHYAIKCQLTDVGCENV